ncbi:MAG TPA: hypothetical protein PLY70_05680 [Saprospiraceae bacterium]|nr:hypothetical protein [Saprospiraceae bacterium]HPN68374.1 hypothetical protein [Saprospiraceae bacterium]
MSGAAFGQTQLLIDSLVTVLSETKNSIEISKKPEAIKIISYGQKSLTFLSNIFDDQTLTETRSEFQNLVLTKGEIAIILADKIEYMPYGRLTNIQNCLLEFCKDNPNLVEYYLFSIRSNNVKEFQRRYKDWLTSKERKEWTPYLNAKKKVFK